MNNNVVNNSVNNNESDINAVNRMTVAQLVAQEHSPLDIVVNPKTGKTFFTCGSKKGYVSPKAEAAIKNGCDEDDLQYAEVSIDGGEAVPTLMIKGKANIIRSFGRR